MSEENPNDVPTLPEGVEAAQGPETLDERELHALARRLAERENACALQERALDRWEADLNERERQLDLREKELDASTLVSPEIVFEPDSDPLRPGTLVQHRGKGPVGKVTRDQKAQGRVLYHVTWPGNKSGTYPRKELTRA